MIRRRGNPNWGELSLAVPARGIATEFEVQVRHLGLAKDNYQGSCQLQDWCEKNRNRCYVPEWLLDAWNMTVDVNYGGVAWPRQK
jgi:hypothetical protein